MRKYGKWRPRAFRPGLAKISDTHSVKCRIIVQDRTHFRLRKNFDRLVGAGGIPFQKRCCQNPFSPALSAGESKIECSVECRNIILPLLVSRKLMQPRLEISLGKIPKASFTASSIL